MAEIVQCDCCGKDLPREAPDNKPELDRLTVIVYNDTMDEETFNADLCKSCAKAVQTILIREIAGKRKRI